MSHRALLLGAMATGETLTDGLLESEDVLCTARAMRAFGAEVERLAAGRWRVRGAGGLREPGDILDCGNAGTAARLMMGAAAGHSLVVTMTGDQSLRRRPMMRVLAPLGLMGATWLCRDGGRLPLTLRGGDLSGLCYRLPQPSAQVKSAVLLAGLRASGATSVIEPEATRDHTERMLRAFGVEVDVRESPDGRVIGLRGGQRLTGTSLQIAGDPSSAAFPLVAALIVPGSEVMVEGVLLNPLRTGLFDTLREMGADLTTEQCARAGRRNRRRRHRATQPAARRGRPPVSLGLDDRRIPHPVRRRRLRGRRHGDARASASCGSRRAIA